MYWIAKCDYTDYISQSFSVLDSYVLHGYKSRASDILGGRGAVKFTKTQKILRDSVEILWNTCMYSIFETYFSYI